VPEVAATTKVESLASRVRVAFELWESLAISSRITQLFNNLQAFSNTRMSAVGDGFRNAVENWRVVLSAARSIGRSDR